MRWGQLEGDGEVLTLYGRELGIKGQFVDVPSLEVEVVRAIVEDIERCSAIVIVAPTQLLDTVPLVEYYNSAIHIKQNVANSCGAIALLHTLVNTSQSPIASKLVELSNSAERGNWIENNEELAQLHERFTTMGQTELPDLEDETNLHFIVMVKLEDGTIWFDGRKSQPMKVASDSDDFVTTALTALSGLVSENSAVNEMAVFALLPDQDANHTN
jgi:hypothetical protein